MKNMLNSSVNLNAIVEAKEDVGLNEPIAGEPSIAYAISHRDELSFISYESSPFCLCMGTLTFKLGNAKFSIGGGDIFWASGGSYHYAIDEDDEDEVVEGPWLFNWDVAPSWIAAIQDEFEEMFNSNVPWGCCGGCI